MRRKFLRQLAHMMLGAAVLRMAPVFALPEDAEKPLEVDTPDGDAEYLLNEGLVIYRGRANSPVKVRQGSMLITGTEIRIKQNADGVIESATAVGSPARFEQQPQANQEVVHISGNTIHFDYAAQTLTIDEAAEFKQGDANITALHIDYDMKTRRVRANSGNGKEQVRSVLPATKAPP